MITLNESELNNISGGAFIQTLLRIAYRIYKTIKVKSLINKVFVN